MKLPEILFDWAALAQMGRDYKAAHPEVDWDENIVVLCSSWNSNEVLPGHMPKSQRPDIRSCCDPANCDGTCP